MRVTSTSSPSSNQPKSLTDLCIIRAMAIAEEVVSVVAFTRQKPPFLERRRPVIK